MYVQRLEKMGERTALPDNHEYLQFVVTDGPWWVNREGAGVSRDGAGVITGAAATKVEGVGINTGCVTA